MPPVGLPRPWSYILPFVAVGLALALTATFRAILEPTPFALSYLAVVVSAVWGGTVAGWIATILVIATSMLFLLEPIGTLKTAPEMVVPLAVAAGVCGSVVILVGRVNAGVESERIRARELERLNRLYSALSRVNQAIVVARSVEELFETVCRVLVESGGFRMAWIGRHDAATHLLVPIAQSGDSGGFLSRVAIYADDRPEGRGVAGLAFRDGHAHVSNDLLADLPASAKRVEAERQGFRSAAAMPIRRGGVVSGTLTVYATELEYFQQEEIELLEKVASDVSFGLDNFDREAERRHAAEVAAHEREIVDKFFDSVPGIIYVYDQAGQFLRWNESFLTVSGYSEEAMGRLRPIDFFRGDDVARVTSAVEQVFQTGRGQVEAGFVSADGRETPYYFTGRLIELAGRPCVVGVGIDVTDRRLAEAAARNALLEAKADLEVRVEERTAELQAALVRAEDADRIKSAFLATMSHELRTPLNSIIGFTGIVLQGLAGPLTPEQSKQLGMVRGSAGHLLDLINDVLDISKIEAGQMVVRLEPVDVLSAVDGAASAVRQMATQKGLLLDIVVPAGLPQMHTDRRRVHQILLNLLNNAVKFTEKGHVRLTVESGDAVVLHGGRPALRFTVADTGMGIKAADLATLFQPFKQVDSGLARHHEGTGLGLAISRRLAELLGGQIAAESTPGVGSRFVVTLPVTSGEPS